MRDISVKVSYHICWVSVSWMSVGVKSNKTDGFLTVLHLEVLAVVKSPSHSIHLDNWFDLFSLSLFFFLIYLLFLSLEAAHQPLSLFYEHLWHFKQK